MKLKEQKRKRKPDEHWKNVKRMPFCPECGMNDLVFDVEGGTDWCPDRRYACSRCKIQFTVEAETIEELYQE